MKIRICAVGQLKAGPEKELFETYLTRAQRLGKTMGVSAIETTETRESVHDNAATRIRLDAASLHRLVPKPAQVYVLDATGKQLTSKGFAELIRKHLDEATANLAFLVGGPDGHVEETLNIATAVLSLGQMTWPHRLARIMLAEQIYRAVTILTNHPYHRP